MAYTDILCPFARIFSLHLERQLTPPSSPAVSLGFKAVGGFVVVGTSRGSLGPRRTRRGSELSHSLVQTSQASRSKSNTFGHEHTHRYTNTHDIHLFQTKLYPSGKVVGFKDQTFKMYSLHLHNSDKEAYTIAPRGSG